jgi:hypothetical protein
MTWRVECVTSAIMDRLRYVRVTTVIHVYVQGTSLSHFERVARVRQGTPIDVIKLYFVLLKTTREEKFLASNRQRAFRCQAADL